MNKLKTILPDVLAIVFFILIGFAYFFKPISEGWVLTGHDHTGGTGSGSELTEYYQRTGERSRWTNVLFCGMPTYQMAPSYDSTDILVGVQKIYQLGLPVYAMYVFIMLLGFYILLRAFDFKVWMAALGAILWAFSSYYFIIIAAGHIWKFFALAFIPPTIAGLVLCYRGKYLWGGVVTALFTALQIMSNHVQMSYYFLSVMLLMALAYLAQAIRNKTLNQWFKATGVLVVAGLLGICINLSNLYHTYEYSKESMRSKSELTHRDIKDPENQTSSGLERDYITQWSYGIGETWTLLVPNTKGGASFPLTASKTAMKKADPQFAPIYQAFGQYWGEQPGTSGPVYVGAFVLMLFVLGLFIVKGPMKWALLIATILSILLSWGKNFMGFTDFFLDYVPMYDKFRTVASILVIAEFTIPLLAMLALKEIVEKPEILKTQFKAVCGSFALTGGIALLFALLPDVFFGQYISTAEYSMLQGAAAAGYIPGEYLLPIVNNLEEMRRAVFVEDAWRSFFVVFLGALLLLAFYMKKINKPIFIGTLIALCLVDLWQVDKRYLNDGMFSEPVKDMKEMVKTPADEQILKDPQLYYRVLNLTTNTFNENNTSFFHKSVGGYHAAKLRRYQEMIEEHITPEMSAFASAATQVNGQMDQVNGDSIYPVLDMLNVKYVIMGQQGGQSFPVLNPHVNGNGWFVSRVKYVPNADEEILSLHHEPLKEVAIVDQRFKEQLGNAAEQQPKDSLSRVELTKYDANALTYEVNSSKGGVVVFSEIYYPGWTATVDGEPVEIARANYILRAIQVPAGKHVLEFKFDPQSVHTTEAIAYTALAILFVGFLFLLYREIRRKKVQKD